MTGGGTCFCNTTAHRLTKFYEFRICRYSVKIIVSLIIMMVGGRSMSNPKKNWVGVMYTISIELSDRDLPSAYGNECDYGWN